jgi:hypothetical protein
LPLTGSGERWGLSVSVKSFSNGTTFNDSLKSSLFLKVIIPEKEI